MYFELVSSFCGLFAVSSFCSRSTPSNAGVLFAPSASTSCMFFRTSELLIFLFFHPLYSMVFTVLFSLDTHPCLVSVSVARRPCFSQCCCQTAVMYPPCVSCPCSGAALASKYRAISLRIATAARSAPVHEQATVRLKSSSFIPVICASHCCIIGRGPVESNFRHVGDERCTSRRTTKQTNGQEQSEVRALVCHTFKPFL